MQRFEHPNELRQWSTGQRSAGERIALVPTMGNLHDGHLALVDAAREQATRVLASIFVNPLQFGPTEDLAAYPRSLARDRERLAAAGCDALFAPCAETMYPHGEAEHTRVEVPNLSEILCGAARPGHFVGVATVVCKLLNMVQPDLALFGEKDYQQLLIIRRMVADLALPVEIVGVPTVREADGLAMSSRNGYLDADERAQAPQLYAVLRELAGALTRGAPIAELERRARAQLVEAGFRPDYVSVRRATDLAEPQAMDNDLIILAAARLGLTRLIDNFRVTL